MIANVQRPSSSFSVFKPRKKSLVVRGTLNEGPHTPLKHKKHETNVLPKPVQSVEYPLQDLILPGSRAASRDGSFGSYSQASFFSRHNPHPVRVRHIKGLNGIPICTVNDFGRVPLNRFNITTPTSRERNDLFKNHLASTTLGINSTDFPIDTITGLQNYPFREKALPRIGLVPITESWRGELHDFCTKVGLTFPEVELQPAVPTTPAVKRETIYSRRTGRIKPPTSRSSHRYPRPMNYNHITSYPDTESLMLELLCQVLHTDSIPSVQQWLVSAGDREKGLVMEIIKSAISQEEEQLKHEATSTAGDVKNVVSMPEKYTPDLLERDDGVESRRSIATPRRPRSTRPLGTAQRLLTAVQEAEEDKLNLPPIMRYSKSAERPRSVLYPRNPKNNDHHVHRFCHEHFSAM